LASSRHARLVCTATIVKGNWFVDGGVTNDLPVAIARDLGATQILGISALGLGTDASKSEMCQCCIRRNILGQCLIFH
jgi:predicted acylesterase/phospholipase RssA